MELVRIAELETSEPAGHWGVDARLVEEAEGRLRVQVCEMEPGGGAESHAHEGRDQMFLVIDGALTVKGEGGRALVVRRGDAVKISANAPHATLNEAEGVARYVVLTYPSGRES